ncbi:hypothetical protein [Polaribacter sargassicola]|uniref:hypothetical protein n=1 Tax=Polaribacter sargassicola TaxID=2836891 RepID=UPI001F355E4B|nr:hypothetical protein [Polaribacter sp. DS7-9]MCG1036799.1 hypothetical protein [Polaribacter sp. DS7-9]
MRKFLYILCVCVSTVCFGTDLQKDSLIVKEEISAKSIDFIQERSFKEDLKEKYNDKDFIYTEEEEPEEKKESESNIFGEAFVGVFLFFISNVFPYLLGAFVIFAILKTFLGSEINFWNFKRTKNKKAKKLIYENEDITETDIEGLLQKAINNKEYRLAIRYYYLSVLKTLYNKKLIDYHKDKTNSEYLLEIEDSIIKKEFSYLSYVYSYVWYGDFPIDETNFKLAENKYQSFKKLLE